MSRIRLLSAVLLMLLLRPVACVAAASPAAAISFTALDGSAHTLSELNGHIAVVNFWATWCGPCREEMPRLQQLSDAYSAKGVTFIAIALDEPETQAAIPGLLQKRGFTIPVWKGATPETLKQLDLGILVPATLILDERGTVIGRIEGEARDKDIRSRLDWLLNGRQGRQPRVVQKNDW